ncbi:MAG: cytochrome bc complex cytochrome b subunit [Mastigocladus sp. ERB_26_2]|uniref:Cytochrome bc complex cytochrome b subunit n=1 Tax=Fischerella muscicola CCMEE 5323 TaxID=2019572 RepID=A0A2N6K285_FISMU|nr:MULTISPECIES: cytochrome b N-terminal domain-containing protein [Fischerella]MBD2431137.1 cytochrome bc complex cytochrome b subunit [Fischerella sp. FACHB-380]PLZ89087.1 cytochrome bc complex cytochrome b subunit [Fischerella muscicola CCMEE 5323]
MESTEFNRVLRRIATVLSVVIITLSLVAASTGILLSFYYEPAAGRAYQSLKLITEQVQYGWLFRKAHNIAGNGVIAIALVQIVVLFLGRQFRKSWLSAWISAIFFTLIAIGLSWTAMILSWDQEGFWRFSIELGTIEAIPLIGSQLREILTGGAISTLTIQRLYTIHSYILSISAIIISGVHLFSVLWQEKQMKAQLLNSEGANLPPSQIQDAGASLAES